MPLNFFFFFLAERCLHCAVCQNSLRLFDQDRSHFTDSAVSDLDLTELMQP